MQTESSGGVSVSETSPAARCPHCGTPTDAREEGTPSVIESLDLDELQTLTRNQWRRRLGPQAFRRRHSEGLIRSLAVLALYPDSPVLREQIDDGLWTEVAGLRADGRGRAAAQREFWALILAMRDVLEDAGASSKEAIRITRPAQDYLGRKLGSPEGWDEMEG